MIHEKALFNRFRGLRSDPGETRFDLRVPVSGRRKLPDTILTITLSSLSVPRLTAK